LASRTESLPIFMDATDLTLVELGWRPFFSGQVSAAEQASCEVVRVMSVHRGMVTVAGERLEESISSLVADSTGPEDRPTVGDWLLIASEDRRVVRILQRLNLFKRPAPGDERRIQLIAANVDTLFIVTSCNQDFNIARLERYLVLAREVGVHPVVVLTKIDLTDAPERFSEAARALQPGLEIEQINGKDFASVRHLATRCGLGQTVALVGSSGVGKSTLINTLRRSDSIATQDVREADGKGRHTTTVREMHRLSADSDSGWAASGWLLDTPGMRELELADANAGIAEVFDDIAALELECRFTNCTHEAQPGCAVEAAIQEGALTRTRVARWRKLSDEDTVNTDKAATRRTRAAAKAGKRT
jgi:ribosome biogenesis GTPase